MDERAGRGLKFVSKAATGERIVYVKGIFLSAPGNLGGRTAKHRRGVERIVQVGDEKTSGAAPASP